MYECVMETIDSYRWISEIQSHESNSFNGSYFEKKKKKNYVTNIV